MIKTWFVWTVIAALSGLVEFWVFQYFGQEPRVLDFYLLMGTNYVAIRSVRKEIE